MAKSTFHDHQKVLTDASVEVAGRSMDQAAMNVRRLQEEQGQDHPGDAVVTFDGTWMRRGHTSLHGVTTAISWLTGQMLDFAFYSMY